ncbi:MAG: hypothetical protein FJ320_01245 [SAR202 cluster bacterium]|nr:hypothetical protein [SAR202 cluster bacterium]
MYRERIVLHTRYGASVKAVEMLKKINEMSAKYGAPKAQILQGVSGRQGTFIFEREFDSFDQFIQTHRRLTGSDEFRQWFPEFQAIMDFGAQEYFTLIE